ncbi:hypothetical protein A9Q99_01880 [Gammaproteobacteria bacterium 45_16_T64]|nr:hypothetical protein A9Q99_01880 [Gammaproteobacteria bacterium 45_16_T64]
MAELSLKCHCGKVQGCIEKTTPKSGIRAVCYCDDCQKFAHFLGDESAVLNEHGGTEVFITAPALVKFTQGEEQLRCMRLTRKGLYRWYTDCCKTPVANVASPKIPFVSLIHSMIDDNEKEASLGPVIGHVQVKFAKDTLPNELKNTGTPYRLLMNSAYKVMKWKVTGLQTPSPFFDAGGRPTHKPSILKSDG